MNMRFNGETESIPKDADGTVHYQGPLLKILASHIFFALLRLTITLSSVFDSHLTRATSWRRRPMT